MTRILIVDDEKNIREGLKGAMEMEGYEGLEAGNGQEALEILKKERVQAILSDLRMPTLSGQELMVQVTKLYPQIPFIMITGHGDVSDAVRAMQEGAFDFLTKPIDLTQLFSILKRALEQTAQKPKFVPTSPALSPAPPKNETIDYKTYFSHSPLMQRLWATVGTISGTNSSVAIESEEGNEIDLVAGMICYYSSRRDNPFFKIDPATLSPITMEGDLFGREEGDVVRKGRLELANHGTIFWENLERLSPTSQTKLLEILKNQSFERVGGILPQTIDIRFLFHDSKSLKLAVELEEFRSDLYALLKILEVKIPPLRERRDNIPFLADNLLKEISLKNRMPLKRLSLKALRRLQAYPFPRNIEELGSVLERVFALAKDTLIEEKELPPEVRFWSDKNQKELIQIPIGSSWEDIERIVLTQYLRVYSNKSTLSRILGISRKTLYRKIEEYKLDDPS